MNLKEDNQFTFGGEYGPEIVDSFYDDNKVYKACERFLKKSFGKTAIEVNKRKEAEKLFDLVGDIPDDIDLDMYIEEYVLEEASYIIVDPFVSEYMDDAQFGEEYYQSEEYWKDNMYLAFESKSMDFIDLPTELVKYMDEKNIYKDDLADFFEDNKKECKCIITDWKGLDTNNFIVLWSNKIGENTHQVDEDLYDAFKNLDDELQEKIIDECSIHGGPYSYKYDGKTIFVDSDKIVNYAFVWKDIKDKFYKEFK